MSHPVGIRKDERQLDIDFARPILETPTRLLHGLVRGSDPIESQAGAVRQVDRLTSIQRTIMTILASDGPHNAKRLEQRIEFRGLGASTVRKRLSELKQTGSIVQVGREDGCAVWDIAPRTDACGKV